MRRELNLLSVVIALVGCADPPGPRTVHNPDLTVKVPVIKDAVERHDLSVAPQLVKDLDSDDPAVRFYAIEGLKRLTGQTFGYVYYDDAERRRAAVMKWRRWLDEHKGH